MNVYPNPHCGYCGGNIVAHQFSDVTEGNHGRLHYSLWTEYHCDSCGKVNKPQQLVYAPGVAALLRGAK